MMSPTEALKQYFGYSSFRAHQEEIIAATMAGRDVLAVLPTGAGKSLCYQLPAVLSPGLTLVISPLIALMKDQVDSMTSLGIAAAALHSGLDDATRDSVLASLRDSSLRLLYVAPERAVQSEFLASLHTCSVSRIVVDEAHCISEWGHDFRPEYRQLDVLRTSFPQVPVLAVTATAIPRVREDIMLRLQMKAPSVTVASFNRPNLTYRVEDRRTPLQQILGFLKEHEDEAGIIYCLSRDGTERLSEQLNEHGILAAPYHAGLAPEVRATTQEKFLRDEILVVCATIAFGMGVNKPNVRFVIHHDLPKNVESYYQETGRAGRDGLPGECLLLYSSADCVKIGRFIEAATDPDVKRQAQRQLRQMTDYAEGGQCRRKVLLGYFGEVFPLANCEGCDICLGHVEMVDQSISAQKLLSAVFRVSQVSPVSFGLSHHAAVLRGETTEAITRWHHQEISTFGIGKELSAAEWSRLGRSLAMRGLLVISDGQYSTVSIAAEGMSFLKTRPALLLPKQRELPDKKRRKISSQPLPHDVDLYERLRAVRLELAKQRSVPAYMIFGDNTLLEMAARQPRSESELLEVSGVGEKKFKDFGERFLSVIAEHRASVAGDRTITPATTPPHSRGPTEGNARLSPRILREHPIESWKQSYDLFSQGHELEEIAKRRGLSTSTVFSHLERAITEQKPVDIARLVPPPLQKRIDSIAGEQGLLSLKKLREAVGEDVSFDMLRIYRSWTNVRVGARS